MPIETKPIDAICVNCTLKWGGSFGGLSARRFGTCPECGRTGMTLYPIEQTKVEMPKTKNTGKSGF